MAELNSQSSSIQTLYSYYRENKLYVNRRYQRKLVWTLLEKQKLIESILKRYPIPAILIAEQDEDNSSYEIIDGVQRLQAILSFIETAFPNLEGKYFNVDYFPTAKKNAEEGIFNINSSLFKLSTGEVSKILDYSVPLSVMRKVTKNEIDDVFDRINTYGHRLSDQERRQAGIQSPFSELVRDVACTIRGDSSSQVLPLYQMPTISIDLPKTQHGYFVQAEEVFWVKQGILRSTDLRDSMDEQCIADITACIIGGTYIDRSKDALDNIYSVDNKEYERMTTALQIYGSDKFKKEFTTCIEEITNVCNAKGDDILRKVIYPSGNTNPFPSVFTIIFMAFHELMFQDHKNILDYSEVRKAMIDLAERIATGQKASSFEERRKNVNLVKGIISPYFVDEKIPIKDLSGHSVFDINAAIQRSQIELANYELKQGILNLSADRSQNPTILQKIVRTIAAISNNGPNSAGKLFIGVTDKEADALTIEKMDKIKPMQVGNKYVVGIAREASILGISIEDYVSVIKSSIRDSSLTDSVKTSVLSSLDFNNYYGLGVIIIEVPQPKELAFVDGKVYWRNVSSTEEATDPGTIVSISNRFK